MPPHEPSSLIRRDRDPLSLASAGAGRGAKKELCRLSKANPSSGRDGAEPALRENGSCSRDTVLATAASKNDSNRSSLTVSVINFTLLSSSVTFIGCFPC